MRLKMGGSGMESFCVTCEELPASQPTAHDEDFDFQRYSWRHARARTGRIAARGYIYRRRRPLDLRARTRSLRRSAETFGRTIVAATWKSRESRANTRHLRAFRLFRFPSKSADARIRKGRDALGGPRLQQHHAIQHAGRVFGKRNCRRADAIRE